MDPIAKNRPSGRPDSASSPSPALSLGEDQLRTVLLAQAIERADGERLLVGQPELQQALQGAIADARGRGVAQVQLADVLLAHAEAVVQRAASREAGIAALQGASTPWRWLARGVPLAALVLGLVADRVANAHRVDLLSPPLLALLAWNLAMYLLLAWRAWRRPGAAMAHAALPWLQRLPGPRPQRRPAAGRRALVARIGADFHARWLAATAALQSARMARVLHLAAAAGGAGIALSLVLRGLVVRYQFGWESTFLDAAQVHAVARVLFWPLTALLGLEPFSLAEISATQDFAGQGAAGNRWVWMYVGLLALVVVLPRLALAGWARWREAQLARHCTLDLRAGEFDALRAALPADIVLGVAPPGGAQAQALTAVLRLHGVPDPAPGAAADDQLRFVTPADAPAAAAPVDVVLLAWGGTGGSATLPCAWHGAPVLELPWDRWGTSWVLEPALFEQLAALLPARTTALARLRARWSEHNRQRFEQALQVLAQHLRACAALDQGSSSGEARAAAYARQLVALDAALRPLHGLPVDGPALVALNPSASPAQSVAPSAAKAPTAALRLAEGKALTLAGTSAGAAAGAAAGAKAGALIDVGLGGLSLGAGTALGALLGGATAWTLRSLQKRTPTDTALRPMVEAACTHYLVLAHQARVPAEEAAPLAARWRAEVSTLVASHWLALHDALDGTQAVASHPARPPGPDALPALLGELLRELLQRSFATAIQAPGAAPARPGQSTRPNDR